MSSGKSVSFLRCPLSAILSTGASVRVLRPLCVAGIPLSVARIAAEAGLSDPAVRGVLASLRDQGIVVGYGERRTQVFEVRTSHPISAALIELFGAEARYLRDIRGALEHAMTVGPSVDAAWIYGSVARGEDRPDSDIDVLAVILARDASSDELLRDRCADIETRFGVRISLVLMDREELGRALAQGGGGGTWIDHVLRDGQAIVGPPPAVYFAGSAPMVVGTTTA